MDGFIMIMPFSRVSKHFFTEATLEGLLSRVYSNMLFHVVFHSKYFPTLFTLTRFHLVALFMQSKMGPEVSSVSKFFGTVAAGKDSAYMGCQILS